MEAGPRCLLCFVAVCHGRPRRRPAGSPNTPVAAPFARLSLVCEPGLTPVADSICRPGVAELYQRHVVDALDAVEPRERECIELRYFDGLSVDEVAVRCEMSKGRGRRSAAARPQRHAPVPAGVRPAGIRGAPVGRAFTELLVEHAASGRGAPRCAAAPGRQQERCGAQSHSPNLPLSRSSQCSPSSSFQASRRVRRPGTVTASPLPARPRRRSCASATRKTGAASRGV